VTRRKRLIDTPSAPPPAPVEVRVCPTVRAAVEARCAACREPYAAGSWCRVVGGLLVHPRCGGDR
jgi:hypothetical protein